MNYSQKYSLVAFLKPIGIGSEFSMADWPPHITIADVFAIDRTTTLEQELLILVTQQSPIQVTAGKDGTLGTTDVTLINQYEKLKDLHNIVINQLERHGALFNNPEFTREGFLPHSTIQKSSRLSKGDEIKLTTLTLVDMFPNGNWQQRKILCNFELS